MMILAFFGDNHQIQSKVVHYLDLQIDVCYRYQYDR